MDDVEQFVIDYLRSRPLAGSRAGGLNGDTRLMESGLLDSLELMSLVRHVEQQYSFNLPEDEFVPENFETPRSIAQTIKRAASSRT
ncbi:MAG: phosphopantetheine-binding protein [Acidobacteriota bacterium]|nr:phosphopantetheine-binding protein [Acidobacteriota bacterium]